MNRLSKALCGAFFLACLPMAAQAAGTQAVAVSSSTFVDLGAAPVTVQATGYPVTIITADSLPSVGAQGNPLLADGLAHLFQPATAISHVYVAMLDKPSLVIVTPVAAASGGGGGVVTGPLGGTTPAASAVATTPATGSAPTPVAGTVTANQGAPDAGPPWFMTNSATAATGGITGFSRIPSGNSSTNLTVAKASPGRVYKITVTNTTAAPIYIKFYNVASGAVVGTTPVFFSRTIAPSTTSNYDFGSIGAYFSAGITYAVVNGSLDADATAVGAAAFIQLEVAFL